MTSSPNQIRQRCKIVLQASQGISHEVARTLATLGYGIDGINNLANRMNNPPINPAFGQVRNNPLAAGQEPILRAGDYIQPLHDGDGEEDED